MDTVKVSSLSENFKLFKEPLLFKKIWFLGEWDTKYDKYNSLSFKIWKLSLIIKFNIRTS